jgi:hypothetical protein
MAGATYTIQIATSMPTGDLTIAQLDELTAGLRDGGKGAAHFQEAIAQVSGELAQAKVVAAEVASELADGNARYAELERAADRAAQAVAKMEAKSEAAAGKLEKASESASGLRASLAEVQAQKAAEQLEYAAASASGLSEDAADASARIADLAVKEGALATKLAAAEKAAATSAKAVERLNASLVGARADADAASGELTAYAGTLAQVEGRSKAAAAEEKRLADALGNVKKLGAHVDKSLAGNSESLSKVQGALGQLGGPVGRLGQQLLGPIKGFADMSQTMGSANAVALVAVAGIGLVVAAVVALGVAAVAGVVSLAAWGVGLADSARNAGLVAEAAEIAAPSLVGLRDAFAEIEGTTGQNAAALRGWEATLRDAKVTAGDMPKALRAIAMAETALGQGGSQQFIDQLKKGKVSVEQLSATVEAKFGGVVDRQMRSLGNQGRTFRSNISDLFGGLDIEPVLDGFETLIGMFDKSSATGRFMKSIFDGVLQPLIDGADEAATVIEAFVIGFAIGLTKMYIAAKPAIKWISELFGFDDTSLSDVLTVAKTSGEAFAKAFVVATAIVGGLFVAVAAVVGVVWGINLAFMAAAGAVAYFAVTGIRPVIGFFKRLPEYVEAGVDAVLAFGQQALDAIAGVPPAVRDYFSSISWEAVGALMVDGIVLGLAGLYHLMVDPFTTGYDAVLAVPWGEVGTTITDLFLAGLAGIGPAVMSSLQLQLQGWLDLFSVGDKWGQIGMNITEGIVQGVISGGAAALDAVGRIASGMLDRAKQVLGIASPSKEMAEVGENTAEGAVVGIEKKTPEVQAAVESLVGLPSEVEARSLGGSAPANDVTPAERVVSCAPANDVVAAVSEQGRPTPSSGGTPSSLVAVPASAPAPAAASAASSGSSAESKPAITGNTFVFQGVKDAEQAEVRFTELVTQLLEGDAEQVSGGSGSERAA